MRKRVAVLTAMLFVAVMPMLAVFNEKDLAHTLSVLRFELAQQNARMENSKALISRNSDRQHQQMVEMIKKCNELSLILYSQNQNFTFDLTYALHEVTEKYEQYEAHRMPYDKILEDLNAEVDRYERLAEALRRLPPALASMNEIPDSLTLAGDSLLMKLVDRQAETERVERMSSRNGGDHAQDNSASVIINSAINTITGGLIGSAAEEGYSGPFMLDSLSQADRDSCLYYARNLLRMYIEGRDNLSEDNDYYGEMNHRLNETYQYAQEKYKNIQKDIFIKGQDNYLKVLSNFPMYAKRAFREAREKYGSKTDNMVSHSEWKGMVVAGFIILVLFYLLFATLVSKLIVTLIVRYRKAWQTENFSKRRPCVTLLMGVAVFAVTIMIASGFTKQHFFKVASGLLLIYAWLLAAIMVSSLIRSKAENAIDSIKIFLPTMVLGLVVIVFRIIFIPNRLVNLIFPPMLVIFSIWQAYYNKRFKKRVDQYDRALARISMAVTVACAVISCIGYVLMSVQVFIWWLFQLAAFTTIFTVYNLLDRYETRILGVRLRQFREDHIETAGWNGGTIEVTWLYDFIKMALVPAGAILSVLICIWMASDVFDLTEICKTIFFKPFVNLSDADGNVSLHLSLYKLVLVSCLFFVFKYMSYAGKAFYKDYKYSKAIKQNGHVQDNDINLTLANNIIGIMVWGTYIVLTIMLLKIPMGAVSIVAAGLATGLGLALKDVLNNFIYGIQLMSGRLRVGDYIECDGVRGKVDSISYQSTQIHALDGSIMSFTNTSLFNERFKNLTKNNAYCLVKIPVGVHYGANVEQVRTLLCDALKKLEKKDRFDRDIVDPSKGINVAFSDFGDSSVDLVVTAFVLVEENWGFMSAAREIIYDTLNSNRIEIPFPQRDVYIRQMPEK